MISYSKILSTSRLRRSDVPNRSIVTESESDRGRVLFCPAFRRLQQKAQVFSMEPNAAVRSRLTHSLEVSQLGRFIADEICTRLKNEIPPTESIAFVNFIETACLLHDIGNPPFGHFGETAIQKWFQENGHNCLKATLKLSEGDLGSGDLRALKALADFKEFDGNPQGLRIITRLQWNTDEYGLNLTKTTLASFLKYIRCAGESKHGIFRKKAGYFLTEKKIVESIWCQFDYSEPQRFPLTYVMEAADDIAYCISDLEDSIEKGLIEESLALKEIEKNYLNSEVPNDENFEAIRLALANIRSGTRTDGKDFTYIDFRTTLNRQLVKYAADRYVSHAAQIQSGELDSLLPKKSAAGEILEILKQYCREHVYCHSTIQTTELAGYTAIRGLLDHYRPLLSLTRPQFTQALNNSKEDTLGVSLAIESKLLSLFPVRYKKVYCNYVENLPPDDDGNFLEWNARAHLVVDFISGMTDDFAMNTYRTLAGMRL